MGISQDGEELCSDSEHGGADVIQTIVELM